MCLSELFWLYDETLCQFLHRVSDMVHISALVELFDVFLLCCKLRLIILSLL